MAQCYHNGEEMSFRHSLILLSCILFIATGCKRQAQEVDLIRTTHPNGQAEHVLTFDVNGGDSLLLRETFYFENGAKQIEGGFDSEGEKDGTWTAWYESGQQWTQAEFRKGSEHGTYTVWHESGEVYYSGKMEDGERRGTWSFYDPEGNMIKEISYSE